MVLSFGLPEKPHLRLANSDTMEKYSEHKGRKSELEPKTQNKKQ